MRTTSNYCSLCGTWWPYAGRCDRCQEGWTPPRTQAEKQVDRVIDRFLVAGLLCAAGYLVVRVLGQLGWL